MAEVIWTEPALSDLDAIADYIALENPAAASALVQRVFDHVAKLEQHPKLGPVPEEIEGSRYRQIVEPPCRVIYRDTRENVFILHVMRSERQFVAENLERQDQKIDEPVPPSNQMKETSLCLMSMDT